MKNIVVLISGRGHNLQALIAAQQAGIIQGRIVAVISNRADAGGLDHARAAGIPAMTVPHADYAERVKFDVALSTAIDCYRPDLVVMAGFMRVVGAAFVRHYQGRMLNIHPSLLPKYPGLKTHHRALSAGDAEHGASVHFVTGQLDGGPVIIQGKINVQAHDREETLSDRVLREVELHIYPQAVAWLAGGVLELDGNAVLFRGHKLVAPLDMKELEEAFR